MKKAFSYLFPFTRKIQSEYNGIVEITWSNGRKILDSAHTNYSYGSLQRILKFGLTKIDLQKSSNVLLLGLGGGSVIKTLREEFNFRKKITAIEIDPVLIDLAANEFDIKTNEQLDIINGDASAFVQNTSDIFDLIIVDLFIDNQVPEIFYSTEFWANITRITSTNGYVIFNASVSQPSHNLLSNLIIFLKKSFSIELFTKVESTNTILIAHKLIVQ